MSGDIDSAKNIGEDLTKLSPGELNRFSDVIWHAKLNLRVLAMDEGTAMKVAKTIEQMVNDEITAAKRSGIFVDAVCEPIDINVEKLVRSDQDG